MGVEDWKPARSPGRKISHEQMAAWRDKDRVEVAPDRSIPRRHDRTFVRGDDRVTLTVEVIDGLPTVTQLVLASPGGIDRQTLQGVPVGALRNLAVQKSVVQHLEVPIEDEPLEEPTWWQLKSTGGHRGRAMTEKEMNDVARVYREAPTRPRLAVAEAFEITPAAAAARISRVRKAGLLPPTTPGRASREDDQ